MKVIVSRERPSVLSQDETAPAHAGAYVRGIVPYGLRLSSDPEIHRSLVYDTNSDPQLHTLGGSTVQLAQSTEVHDDHAYIVVAYASHSDHNVLLFSGSCSVRQGAACDYEGRFSIFPEAIGFVLAEGIVQIDIVTFSVVYRGNERTLLAAYICFQVFFIYERRDLRDSKRFSIEKG